MRMTIKNTKGRVEYNFIPEHGDGEHPDGKTKMENIPVYFENHLIPEMVHNDILCLVGVLLVDPFVNRKLTLPIPVSEKFLEGTKKVITRYEIDADVDGDINPRSIPENGFPGLAFSGGCDSTAALCVMPDETIPVFLERPMSGESAYDSDAALTSCELVKDMGYQMEIMESNFEYLRNPVGFPSDLAHASVLLLICEELGLDSLNFGTVLESAYGIGHPQFRDYGNGSHWRLFSTLFDIVGLDLSLPVCGISEVGTAIICEKSDLGYIHQSCIRGAWMEPCRRCWKCFRKELLNCALGTQEFDVEIFSAAIISPDVVSKLRKIPISHENVLSFSASRIEMPIQDDIFKSLKRRLVPGEGLDYLYSWYSPSISFVTKKYREIIKAKILSILREMKEEEEKELESWDINRFIESKRTLNSSRKLLDIIS